MVMKNKIIIIFFFFFIFFFKCRIILRGCGFFFIDWGFFFIVFMGMVYRVYNYFFYYRMFI